MKKYSIIVPVAVVIALLLIFVIPKKTAQENMPADTNQPSQPNDTASMVNPASKYCEDNGGKLKIITGNDGGQIGLCQLLDYTCEEWTYYRGECNIENDAAKIKEALIQKGLNLTGMKVVITNHFGKYIGGGVVPKTEPAGGGYVFAVKKENEIKILADGNGAIMCSWLKNYPDYPTYLIPECIDATGNPVSR
ncbi:MAG: DUF333 domain-containing protein [bacterium]